MQLFALPLSYSTVHPSKLFKLSLSVGWGGGESAPDTAFNLILCFECIAQKFSCCYFEGVKIVFKGGEGKTPPSFPLYI